MHLKKYDTKLYFDIKPEQWPIVYRKEYNVYFMGFEKIHPFDSAKWGNVFKYLKTAGLINEDVITVPNEATKDDLLVVHTKKYLKCLKYSFIVATIVEVLPLCFVPNFLVQKKYLKPMRYQTGGSILAGKLALERGWAINIGGGFHHCSAEKGGGFCAYADITLLIRFLFIHYANIVENVMILDLDAHQGNGYEHDFTNNPKVYIMDVYNKDIYPFDHNVKLSINKKIELTHFIEDEEYLNKVKTNFKDALNEFLPQLIVYNAGTDILKGDSLGGLSISPQGIIERDELVFTIAREKNIPIVMLTSGGYLRRTAKIIACSILNLYEMNLIQGPHVHF